MQVTWHSFDLRSGRRGPAVTVGQLGKVSRLIGEGTETALAVRCYSVESETSADGMPTQAGEVPGWDAATLPGRAGLIALDENEAILWGGFAFRRVSDITSSWVGVHLVTLEGYFERRFVSNHVWAATDQATIFTGLIGDATTLGVSMEIDAPATGVLRDRAYADAEDKNVLDALQELVGVEEGLEFTVDLLWEDETHRRVVPTVRARKRLGTASTRPEVTFSLPGSIVSGNYLEDYSTEHGATAVRATSTGEGAVRPTSALQLATDQLNNGWAYFERRIAPSTAITTISVLDSHAAAELAEVREGLKELKIDAKLDAAPHLSTWSIGDDVGISLTCPRFPARLDADGAKIDGYSQIVRCIGWDVDFDAGILTPRTVEVAS